MNAAQPVRQVFRVFPWNRNMRVDFFYFSFFFFFCEYDWPLLCVNVRFAEGTNNKAWKGMLIDPRRYEAGFEKNNLFRRMERFVSSREGRGRGGGCLTWTGILKRNGYLLREEDKVLERCHRSFSSSHPGCRVRENVHQIFKEREKKEEVNYKVVRVDGQAFEIWSSNRSVAPSPCYPQLARRMMASSKRIRNECVPPRTRYTTPRWTRDPSSPLLSLCPRFEWFQNTSIFFSFAKNLAKIYSKFPALRRWYHQRSKTRLEEKMDKKRRELVSGRRSRGLT